MQKREAKPVGARPSTDDTQVAADRRPSSRFLDSLDQVNAAIHATNDLDQMLRGVLDVTLSIFDCDRAWLVFPCDPEAPSWSVPAERTRPEFPGSHSLGLTHQVDDEVIRGWRALLAADGPLQFTAPRGLPRFFADRSTQLIPPKTFIAMALRPRIGKPWLFGLHQCSRERRWSAAEETLFQHIGRRLTDALASLLSFQCLQRSEREFRNLAEQSPDLIIRLDTRGRYLYASPMIEKVTGFPPSAFLGREVGEVSEQQGGHRGEIFRTLRDAVGQVIAGGAEQRCETALPDGSGLPVIYETRLAPERGAKGEVASVLCFTRNVTERRRSENALQALNRSLRLLSEAGKLLIHADDEQTLLEDICRLLVEIGEYPAAWVVLAGGEDGAPPRVAARAARDRRALDPLEAWPGPNWQQCPTGVALRTGEPQLVQDITADPRTRGFWNALALQHGVTALSVLALRSGGDIIGALVSAASHARAFTPEELGLQQELADDLAYGMHTLRARTEHRVAREKLAFLAHHDPLTGLPNRLKLRERFGESIDAARRRLHRIAMLFLDLDNFKEINDSFGHDLGDRLLVRVAERLRAFVPRTGIVSREGGDEFLVVLTEVGGAEAVECFARQILATMEQPFEVEGYWLHITLSIGVSLFPEDGTDFETLRRNSDAALFCAKDGGRNICRFFDPQMNRDAVERVQLQAQLRAALRCNEFELHYQPQVRSSDGRVLGLEALIRWRRPGAGRLVMPSEFVPLAEKSGLIVPIGQWVLDEACRQAAAWHEAGMHGLTIAVNVSIVQFTRGNIVESVKAALNRWGLNPPSLELELTESVLLHETDGALQTLQALKSIGVKLSIDDFGTGYSSLSYIKRLAVDKLKIAQSFVRDVVDNPQDAAIVRAIVQLGKILHLEVIAEGVETEAQLAYLKAHGCDQVQGYLLGRPQPAERCLTALRDDSRRGP